MVKQDHALSPVSLEVNVAKLPQRGMRVKLDASPEQLKNLAAEHGLLSVERYKAELVVAAWKRNGVSVTGKVSADLTQACGVTLEPLTTHIEEEVSGVFLPATSKLGREGFGEGGEILVAAEGPDAPELFSGDSIDVGALAEEFFVLAIDPYPRKPGMETAAYIEDDEPAESPFSRLSALKKPS
ncbi:DUF177 domain-containing protein [Mesorhizobium sp. NBSH29]|uniref:YceD family protein n=1 Tax=Mesorhizobium sp. NBSH29 TaxID=2654249 RepID=UPI0018965599|nr:DUF177 domain-containing protein [Mesorhizobium sp. NBSH29]QPC87379.1 DUF177 domain-containing protein [Mesorhizobium sp. NBSH29]